MTQLSERLKEVGIEDPGADYPTWDDLHLRQLEEERDEAEARIRRARQDRERRERDRRLAEEDRARRERAEAERQEQQKRAGRVIAFYGELGVYGIAVKPVDCWSARCRERRRAGVTVPPALHVSLVDGSWWCQDCPSRGGLAEAARAFGEEPVPLLRRYGFTEQAELIERRRKALETINRKLEHLGRADTRFGDLRTMRDNASSLEELETVAEKASKMRRKAGATKVEV
jgi:chromosome segregation ATPase